MNFQPLQSFFASITLLGAVAGFHHTAAAQTCGNGTDSCLSAHTLPACSDSACCTTVCALTPECCLVTWDAACAALADSSCVGLCGATASGLCSSTHSNGGCADATCCTTVCAADPSCCSFAWDGTCVLEAEFYCASGPPVTCGLAGQGPCGATHSTPGCSDATCCNTVCSVDPSCCTGAWDQFCVQFSVDYCSGCTISCPTTGQDEGEACGMRSNDPCAGGGQVAKPLPINTEMCGLIDGTSVNNAWTGDRDVYSLTVTDTDGDGQVKVILHLGSTFPAFAVLVPASCPVTPSSALIHVNAPNCADASSGACLAPGTYWVMVVPGTYPTANTPTELFCLQVPRYLLRAEVTQVGCSPACTPAAGPCFEPHATPGCSTVSCCQATCVIDPFCCSTNWDVDCARTAAVTCNAPLPPNDTCLTALPIAVGQTMTFSTIRATIDSLQLPSTCDGGTGAVIGPDLWYSYNSERSGNVVASTCGSATDLRIAIYSGTCTAPTLVACGSSSVICSPTSGARVQFQSVCGVDYWIRVGGENPQQAGTGSLKLTGSGPICPDHCPSDLNRDGVVNGGDLGLLLGNWGGFGLGDLNLNGRVDGADLGILLGVWGPCA